jgi:DNA-binding CsgD family transcriptional regulator
VGRDEERAMLGDLVRRARGSLVVAGEMGVGKSRLVADLLGVDARGVGDNAGGDGDNAGGDGGVDDLRTVQVRATRSTATIPFGPFAAWAPAPSGVVGDRLGVLQSITRSLLADGRPLVVAVDDAHALDDGSAALVLHLATQTSASVVATVRSGEPCPDAITALWKEGLAPRVELQGLSEAETVELVEQVLDGPLSLPLRRRVWTLTQGIPLYVREVVEVGLDAGVVVREDGIWTWRGDLAAAGRLADLVGARLAHADEAEREVVELLAFGEPLPLAVVDRLGLRDALGSAEGRGLVTVDRAPAATDDEGPSARLVHPLYAEVLRATVPHLAARSHQGRLAAAAAALGRHARDPLRVASWWLASGAPPDAPDVFLAAARRALALAEWDLAARMAEAAERSGAGPPATLVRAMALDVHRWEEADDLLEELGRTDMEDAFVAEAAAARAGIVLFNRGLLDDAREILGAAAERLHGPARAIVEAQAAYLSLLSVRPDLAVDHVGTALADAGDAADVRVGALSVAALAWALEGRTEAAIATAELMLPFVPTVVATDPSPVALNATGVLPVAHSMALVVAGRLAEAAASAETSMLLAKESDFRILYAVLAALDGRMALFRGRPALARQRGEEGLAVVRELNARFEWPAAVAALGAAQLGDVARAHAALAWLEENARPPVGLFEIELRQARAWLAAAQGDLTSARAQLEALATDMAASGVALFQLLALTDLARLGGAARAAPRLVDLAARMEGALPAATARYATARAADDATGLDAAAAELESLGFELLAAEAAAAAAAAHRAAGRRGSHLTSLARARTLAARCDGARTPALRDLDAEPALAALTAREREVVELAARGLANREIAGELFVSIRTVHTHLHRAYAKLGVNDREQLSGIFGDRRPRV